MNVFRVIRLPDIFTLLNLLFGSMAILYAAGAKGVASLQYALVFILLAAMADGLDGLVARKMGGSPLGANLDSLADLVSFGLAPPFLAIFAFHMPPHIWPAAIFFLFCGALRLARFNIVSAKSDRHFEGLPIPAAGLALSASVLLGRPILTILLMILLALLMTSSIPYPKIRDLRLMSLFSAVYILVAAVLLWQHEMEYVLLATIVLAVLILLYMISPVVIKCLRKEK
jgi:CDP-diacylglycerol--serine O-phosphatidyltransferase